MHSYHLLLRDNSLEKIEGWVDLRRMSCVIRPQWHVSAKDTIKMVSFIFAPIPESDQPSNEGTARASREKTNDGNGRRVWDQPSHYTSTPHPSSHTSSSFAVMCQTLLSALSQSVRLEFV